MMNKLINALTQLASILTVLFVVITLYFGMQTIDLLILKLFVWFST